MFGIDIKTLLLFNILFLHRSQSHSHSMEWFYKGPKGLSHWGDVFGMCKGKHQSPININTNQVNRMDKGEIIFHNYNDLSEKIDVVNNGHTIKFSSTVHTPFITSDKLFQGKYFLKQFHFHWGKQGDRGSEHNIDQQKYSLELHAVHMSEDEPKLLVVAYFFSQVPDKEMTNNSTNHDLEDFLKFFQSTNILAEGNKDSRSEINTEITRGIFDYGKINDHEGNLTKFCTYEGSLTTPPCSEGVTWVLDMNVREISKRSMWYFHKQVNKYQDPLDDNYRNLQPLNDREVTCSGLPEIEGDAVVKDIQPVSVNSVDTQREPLQIKSSYQPYQFFYYPPSNQWFYYTPDY